MISKEEFDNYCNDKTLIMVGNGNSLIEKNEEGNYKITGDFVDSHDIVLRFNAARPGVFKTVIGSRTDIWSTNRHHKKNHFAFPDKKYVVFPCLVLDIEPEVEPITYQIPSDLILEVAQDYNPDKNVTKENLMHTNKKWPTTGLILFYYFIKHIRYKSITMVGFDFLQKKTFYYKNTGYNGIRTYHDKEAEERLFTKARSENENIVWIK
jgi:hypothetical protein